MPSIITIADAQVVPVDHVFAPNGYDKNQTFWWVDSAQTNALGYWKIAASLTSPAPPKGQQSSEGRNYRVKIQVLEPVLANVTNSTVSGIAPVPTLAYAVRSYHEFVLPEAGTELDRKNISKMSPLILQNPQIAQIIENLSVPGL